ncbi:cupin domain-containing protein [Streptomyces sp. NPDC045431]|uniref:cupin domain-containing protein n=1 Tax=Streptomyces sp. NPDC045431 TaxID=3155613 RepID=UPI00340EE563
MITVLVNRFLVTSSSRHVLEPGRTEKGAGMTQTVVWERAAETVELPSGAVFRLLVDGGAAGVNRLTLPPGADGAKPHRHLRSTELLYVLGGALEVLLDADVRTVTAGDLVVVPPGLTHAFRAAPDRGGGPAGGAHARSGAVRVLPGAGADRARRGPLGEPAAQAKGIRRPFCGGKLVSYSGVASRILLPGFRKVKQADFRVVIKV